MRCLVEVAGVDFSACCADSGGTDEEDEEDEERGMTGLHLAAIHDSPEIANLLIKKECPVDTQDEKVCMCVHTISPQEEGCCNSVLVYRKMCIIYMLAWNREMSYSCPQGETALHIAVRKASFDVADILKRTPEGERLKHIRNKVGTLPVACIVYSSIKRTYSTKVVPLATFMVAVLFTIQEEQTPSDIQPEEGE